MGCQGQRHTRYPSGQRRGQSQGKFVHAQHRHAEGLQPVHTYGFIKPVGAVQGGVTPIATVHHFACGFRESAFVYIKQQALTQAQ